jgi:hypothetical protein
MYHISINIHLDLSLSSSKECPLSDLLLGAVRSWLRSVPIWRIFLSSSYYVYARNVNRGRLFVLLALSGVTSDVTACHRQDHSNDSS